jgi:RNA polymerase sigma-70 factor (ECF subfamily)
LPALAAELAGLPAHRYVPMAEREERDDHDRDQQLVRAVLSEEPAAIDAFVARLRCIPRILSVLNQRVGGAFQPDDLDDLSQDTLTAFWTRLGDYSGQSALETWAYGFCVNGFMSALRRKRTRSGVAAIDDDLVAPVVSAGSGSVEYEHLYRVLERLELKAQCVIRHKYFDELTFEEIGARMRMSSNTAKTCYYRGMKRLEGLLRLPPVEES